MAQHDPVLALMKFGSAAHMAELLCGRLYMQPIRSFRTLEADAARGDQHEGLAQCWQADSSKLEIRQGDEWLNVGGIEGQILFRDQQAELGNLFCMFALRGSQADAFLDGRSPEPVDVDRLAFGDSVVVFTDGDQFLRRVRAAAERDGLEIAYDLVTYVERESYHGPMGPFREFSTFGHQSEFRIMLRPEQEHARILDIGPLRDIAMRCPSSELNRRLRLQHVEAPT